MAPWNWLLQRIKIQLMLNVYQNLYRMFSPPSIISFFVHQRCRKHREALLLEAHNPVSLLLILELRFVPAWDVTKCFWNLFLRLAEWKVGWIVVGCVILACLSGSHTVWLAWMLQFTESGLVRMVTASCSDSLCIVGARKHQLHYFHIYIIIDIIPWTGSSTYSGQVSLYIYHHILLWTCVL